MISRNGKFWRTESGRAVAAAGRALAISLRAFLASMWKIIITTWRLAAALDSALWRGFLLIAKRVGRWLRTLGSALEIAFAGFVSWLPTPWGRSYSAVFGLFVMVAMLWGLDEIRSAASSQFGSSADLEAPIDRQDPILARIDGRYVHLSEIAIAARASGFLAGDEELSVDGAFERKLVETYVEQRLLANAAQDAGIHRAPTILRRMNAARDRILAAAFVEVQTDRIVTPNSIEKLYTAQKDVTILGDEINARHILLETQAAADLVFAELAEGGDFAEIARERSQDTGNAVFGGEIGWITRDMVPYSFSKAVFAADAGTILEPFESDFGWHVVEIHDRRATNSVPIDDVRDDIEEFLRFRAIEETLSVLEEDHQVVYFRPQNEIGEVGSALSPSSSIQAAASLDGG